MRKKVAYLRKSRKDVELESFTKEDTLNRHREIIKDLAKKNNVILDFFYEEVVSGETIEERPKIKELLHEIEQNNIEEVYVIDVDRLARGDTEDQGRIAKTFQFGNTKIVTPIKTYDPNNEFDEEFFEFGLFMSRREYKTITRRLNRGRISSINEGKYIGSICPYGYTKEKLKGQKGFRLIPNEEEAKIVKMIFQKACCNIGSQKIANYLNQLGVKTRKGKEWTYSTIRDILQNEVYYGMIRWGYRKTEKKMRNGTIYKSRPKHQEYTLVKGLHEPLITKEIYEKAKKLRSLKQEKSIRKDKEIQNPLMGLVKCSVCGRRMQRKKDILICPRPHCRNVGSYLYLVENRIIESLKEIIKEYHSIVETFDKKDIIDTKIENKNTISMIKKEITKVTNQLNKAYDLLEQEIYDKNTFFKRRKELKEKLKFLENETKKYQASSKIEKQKNLVPNLEMILKQYNNNLTTKEKNELLIEIIDHVEYLKVKKGQGHEDEFTLKIRVKLY